MYKLRKFISLTLIITLMFARVFVVLPVAFADDVPSVPTAPSAPSAPSGPGSPPPPPSAPSAPSAPSGPPAVPTAPSAPSGPAAAPTVPPLPTSGGATTVSSLPTSPAEPTEPTSNTTNSLSNSEDLTGNASPIGSSGDQNGYNSSSGDVNDPANVNTGAGSQNEAYENLNQKLSTMNQNLAELQNKIDAVSTSGFNSANFNTLNGQVLTGDTAAAINLMNKLNSNMTGVGTFEVFNIYGTYLNDIVFQMADSGATGSFSNASPTVSKNVVTGAGSNNIADASNNFTVNEANGNDAKLTNDINLQAVTGSNSSSYNTGSGIVSTGDATAVGNVVNLTNTNINAVQWLWGVVNIFGEMVGNIILPQDTGSTDNGSTSPAALVENSATGPLSNNTANYTSNNTTSFENSNLSDINTDINVTANSGNNTSDTNTGGGLVLTGSTDVAVTDTTIANSNTNNDDGTVWMVVVNEAGKWVGHIIGLDWGTDYASNVLPMSQTDVQNTGTGSASNNTSSYSETNNTTVTNNNTASIENNINVTADTGNNTAAFNTGAGVIQTGDAKAGLNIVNMANTNVTAKKFVAILVNVLGSWLGDVVTPDQQLPASGGTDSGNSTNNTDGVLPTLPPLPTLAPIGENNDSYDYPIGGTEDSGNSSVTYTYTYYDSQDNVNYVYPAEYAQSVNQINYAQYWMWLQQQRNYAANTAQKVVLEEQGRVMTRGLFLSAAFAKATESSFPAMLLGGATLKVTGSWLWVIPVALFIFILRRRKKFSLEKYLNMLLSIVL